MEEKARKILIFATSYLPLVGGAEIALKSITDRIDGFDFDLITSRPSGSLLEQERIGNINIFRVGGRGALLNFIIPKTFLPFSAYFKAKELMAKNKYDLIFLLQASQVAGAVWLLKKFSHIKQPIVLNLQEGRNFKTNPLKQFFFKRIVSSADYVTAISSHLKVVAQKYGAKKKPIKIIPNGVDMKNFSQEFSYGELTELSDKLGIKPDEKVIISVSRLAPKNGIGDLIQAMGILVNNWQGLRYKLLLAGSGKLDQPFRELTHKLGIARDVVFAGDISHEELPKYLRIADVFVRPSLSEGLGNAFLEAMASGVAIVGTPVGGIPDFLIEGETGFFCEVGNPQSIAEKIKLIFDDEKLSGQIIGKAYKLVKEKYNWTAIAAEYEKLFNELTTDK